MLESTQVKHINAKTAKVDPKDAIRTSAAVFMLRIWGVVQGVKNFEDRKSGDVKTVFIGEFAAQGPKGDLFGSDKMFCFKALEEKLSSSFISGGEKAIEFAYDITALPDDKAATGYVYAAKSVVPTQASDRLNALAKQIANLPMPGTESAKQDGQEASETAQTEPEAATTAKATKGAAASKKV